MTWKHLWEILGVRRTISRARFRKESRTLREFGAAPNRRWNRFARTFPHTGSRVPIAKRILYGLLSGLIALSGCDDTSVRHEFNQGTVPASVVTERVITDSEDPAIWVDFADPTKSLILGTDKDNPGRLYVFDLDGRIDRARSVHGLRRPNNVDIEYGLVLDGVKTDIAAVTERNSERLRIFSLPDMTPIDNGGIEVFRHERYRRPEGIALYKRPSDSAVFAIVSRHAGSRKDAGPEIGKYLWQYRLDSDGSGHVKGTLVRKFGKWSGRQLIESVAVDDALGYVYYSDETIGVRKYFADPERNSSSQELALFGKDDFRGDLEGIAIYQQPDGTGYILVSAQMDNALLIYPREGARDDPHNHQLIAKLRLSTTLTDGIEVTHLPITARFPRGLLVAMSNDRTFHFYDWRSIAGDGTDP